MTINITNISSLNLLLDRNSGFTFTEGYNDSE